MNNPAGNNSSNNAPSTNPPATHLVTGGVFPYQEITIQFKDGPVTLPDWLAIQLDGQIDDNLRAAAKEATYQEFLAAYFEGSAANRLRMAQQSFVHGHFRDLSEADKWGKR